MDRTFSLRVAFEPTRLSAEYLRRAYERVIPISRRDGDDAQGADLDETKTSSEEPLNDRQEVS
jgi:hypothetical protein